MKRQGQERLNMYIPDFLHKELKLFAEQRGINLTRLITRILFRYYRENYRGK